MWPVYYFFIFLTSNHLNISIFLTRLMFPMPLSLSITIQLIKISPLVFLSSHFQSGKNIIIIQLRGCGLNLNTDVFEISIKLMPITKKIYFFICISNIVAVISQIRSQTNMIKCFLFTYQMKDIIYFHKQPCENNSTTHHC